MTIDDAIKKIHEIGIVPVVRAANLDEARRAVDAICAGGIPIIEVTMTVPDAPTMIKELVQSKGIPCLFTDYRELLKQIQNSYNASVQATELDVLRPVFETEVVVLDELGAVKPTEWVWDTVSLILNTRYNQNRTTIITTNFPNEPAHSAEASANHPAIYDEKADGAKQIADALAVATNEHKRVLLQFGANWCGWCHKLHKLFETDADIEPGFSLFLPFLIPTFERLEHHLGAVQRARGVIRACRRGAEHGEDPVAHILVDRTAAGEDLRRHSGMKLA